MWHWANDTQVPVDPFNPKVAAEARQRLVDAVEPPQRVEPLAAPQQRPAANGHHPGLAPAGVRAPSWWKGDRAAFSSSLRAASDLGYRGTGIPPRRR